jgi:hypothetical protein
VVLAAAAADRKGAAAEVAEAAEGVVDPHTGAATGRKKTGRIEKGLRHRSMLAEIMTQGTGTVLIRVVDPDSETLWIRIRIGNPDPDPGARK